MVMWGSKNPLFFFSFLWEGIICLHFVLHIFLFLERGVLHLTFIWALGAKFISSLVNLTEVSMSDVDLNLDESPIKSVLVGYLGEVAGIG